jgi:geranylgeranyl reductase family protein
MAEAAGTTVTDTAAAMDATDTARTIARTQRDQGRRDTRRCYAGGLLRSLSDVLSADAVVVGAGPAGAAAAIHLADAGRSVVVCDKAVFPRDKCCGDGLTTLALRELAALRFDPGAIARWTVVDEALLRAPSGREVELPLPAGGTYAAVAPRCELDAALVDLVSKTGVTLRMGTGFAGLTRARDRTVVELDDGAAIETSHVIAADGMWSPVRRSLGLARSGDLGEWHAFRQYVSGVTGPAATRLYVWFEPDLLPGYAWSFPLPDGRANVGYGVLRADGRKGAEMRALWHDVFERPHIRDALGGDGVTFEDRVLAWPIPGAVTSATLSAGGVLFAGDAAAASDVLTGEGIGQALLMGRLAADAIVASGGQVDDAARRYEREVRRELFADHRLSAALGRVLSHRRGANGALAIVAASGTWGRTRFARWMFEDEPRAIVATPRRWHRRFFSRPSPFPGTATAAR